VGKNSIYFRFSHMRFIEKIDCKVSVSNGSVNALSTCKIKSILLLLLPPKWILSRRKLHIKILQS